MDPGAVSTQIVFSRRRAFGGQQLPCQGPRSEWETRCRAYIFVVLVLRFWGVTGVASKIKRGLANLRS